MASFDQFANQGGAAAWDPTETAGAQRVAEEQLQNADYAGDLPEPLRRNAPPHVVDDAYLDDEDASDFSDDELGDAEDDENSADEDERDEDEGDDDERDEDDDSGDEYPDDPEFSDHNDDDDDESSRPGF